MEKFFKENWFKVVVLILITFLGLLYLFLIRPQQEKKESLLNNIRCQQEGLILSEKDKKAFLEDYNPKNEWKSFDGVEYKFTDDLNTCLYKYSTFSASDAGTFYYKYIKDVYSNKTLASYTKVSITNADPIITESYNYETMETLYFPQK